MNIQPTSASGNSYLLGKTLGLEEMFAEIPTYPNACGVGVPGGTNLPACLDHTRACERRQSMRDEPIAIIRIFLVIGAAQIEMVQILLAVTVGGVGFIGCGREKVSPDILCGVISGNDVFQPSAIV